MAVDPVESLPQFKAEPDATRIPSTGFRIGQGARAAVKALGNPVFEQLQKERKNNPAAFEKKREMAQSVNPYFKKRLGFIEPLGNLFKNTPIGSEIHRGFFSPTAAEKAAK